jgi:hypothetical protein
MQGTVVIGEGERDEAPMLFIGETVGTGQGQKIDIALDPLEGTTLTAKEMPDALSVIAMAEGGSLLHAPDCYMDKIASAADSPTIWWTWTQARRRTSGAWPRPRACRRAPSPPASSTGRATPS